MSCTYSGADKNQNKTIKKTRSCLSDTLWAVSEVKKLRFLLQNFYNLVQSTTLPDWLQHWQQFNWTHCALYCNALGTWTPSAAVPHPGRQILEARWTGSCADLKNHSQLSFSSTLVYSCTSSILLISLKLFKNIHTHSALTGSLLLLLAVYC